MKVKEENEKAGLKLNIEKTKIMASGPITSWQIDGETMETVTDFILGGSKITADGDCNHEIKRWAAGGARERSIKGRDPCAYQKLVMFQEMGTTMDSTKIHIVKAIVFPVVMYGFDSWTIKKAER